MRNSEIPDDFHPGDITAAKEIKHRHTPRRMKFHASTDGADRKITRMVTAAALFILVALFACLAMWLATLGPFTGGPMVIPGRLF